eukprot:TRINITY_DN12608_c0_g1_i4.p1 TRINITY_DN12608_c0_g1~~TRINITY_DN12608_c0_g1_i4.p1  ORF type:complete len:467 (-),score=86.12 TRINITY_DN12608_c0_g1_i4:103-1503(-)
MLRSLVGSEMCIRDRVSTQSTGVAKAMRMHLLLLAAILPTTSAWDEADTWAETDLGTAVRSWGRRRAPAGSSILTFGLKMATKLHSESASALLEAKVVGSSGNTTWLSLGSGWGKEAMGKGRTVKVKVAKDVGVAKALILRTNVTDGLLLEHVEVTSSKSKDVVYFDTSKLSIRCRYSGAWFGVKKGSKKCDYSFPPSDAPSVDGGAPACKQHTVTTAPLTSTFKKAADGLQLNYKGFTVYMDCSLKAAYRFEYTALNDCGMLARRGSFSLDPKVDKSCQQKNGAAYPTTLGVSFDRGHLVPANHLDSDKTAIYESNYMTNILPQAALMNRGAWLQTEEIIECLRVKEQVYVLGGAVFDKSDPRYNWFEESHGVKNPSFFWKVLKAKTLHPETGHYLAIWMPNSETAVRSQLNSYVVSLSELESRLAKYQQPQIFDAPFTTKEIWPKAAWSVPSGCDKQLLLEPEI